MDGMYGWTDAIIDTELRIDHVSPLRALPQRRRHEAMHEVHDLLLLRQGVSDEELETNAQARL